MLPIGKSKGLTVVVTRNHRGYFINVNNHRTIGPLDEEPTFAEALAMYEAIEKLEG